MSAVAIGSNAVTRAARSRGARADDGVDGHEPNVARRFVRWIPGDAIAFYTALLALDVPTGAPSTPLERLRIIDPGSVRWFLFALAVAVLLVITGAANERRQVGAALPKLGRSVALRCLFTAVAFLLWASLLPTSWPSNLHIVQDLGPAYVLVLGVIATLFTWVAERVTGSDRWS